MFGFRVLRAPLVLAQKRTMGYPKRTMAVFSSTELVAADFLLNTVAHCSISFVFGKNCSNFD
jgi:hypothetical protein